MPFSKRLDKSRPFGSYHPPDNGVFFEQDGYPFDHEGQIVEHALTPKQKAALAEKEKKPAEPPAPKATTKPRPPAPVEPNREAGGEGGDPAEAKAGDDINLELYLRGHEDYPFPAVQKAVKARMNVWKTGKRDLIMFLVEDQKLVAVEDLSDEFKSLIGA